MKHSLKTEHSGPKKGQGAYWGPRQEAKKISRKKRRSYGKVETRELFKNPEQIISATAQNVKKCG